MGSSVHMQTAHTTPVRRGATKGDAGKFRAGADAGAMRACPFGSGTGSGSSGGGSGSSSIDGGSSNGSSGGDISGQVISSSFNSTCRWDIFHIAGCVVAQPCMCPMSMCTFSHLPIHPLASPI